MTPHRPSIRDIAKRADVSTATVSLALRDHPRISAPVRARVKAIATEMGYTPDPLISRIAANGWNARRENGHTTAAFVCGYTQETNSSDTSYFKALEPIAPRMGYRVDYFALPHYRSPRRLADVLEARGIRGILLHQISDAEFVTQFPWERFATIACSVSIAMPPVHLVVSDYALPIQKSWETCLRAGYRRIGFALLKETNPHDDLTRTGIADYLERHGRRREVSRVPVEHFSRTARTAFLDWVKKHRLDVVIGLNDLFHWWLVDSGTRVPEQIGFLSLMRGLPEISGWDTREDLVVQHSLEQLDLMLRSGSKGLPECPYSLHIQPRWVPGSSLRPAPPVSAGEAGT